MENKYKILIFVLSIFIVGCTNLTTNEITNYEPKSTGSLGAGDVLIELTPLNIKDGKLNVKIDMNTHNIDLAQFDLKQITTLEYNGKSINPIDVPILRGHHSSGILIFNVDNNIKDFTIKIKNIPPTGDRIFEWKVR